MIAITATCDAPGAFLSAHYIKRYDDVTDGHAVARARGGSALADTRCWWLFIEHPILGGAPGESTGRDVRACPVAEAASSWAIEAIDSRKTNRVGPWRNRPRRYDAKNRR